MPHFSRSKFKMRGNVQMMDETGEHIEYRGIAFIQFRTEWDDQAKRFTPMTAEQKKICEDLHQQLSDAGVELGVTVSQRVPGVEDVREYPKVMQFQLMVNDPQGYTPAPTPAAAPAQSYEAAKGGGNGW